MVNESILIVSSERIGDAIMSMPAVQIFRQENPAAKITVLGRLCVKPLWQMHPAVDDFQTLERNFPTIGKLKQPHFDRAYIFPDSFRSAYLPFMAGVPRRIGARGHWRRLMLTEIVHLPNGHRQFEYMNILGVQGEPPAPQIAVPAESFQTLERKLCHFPNLGKNASILFQCLENDRPDGSRPVITLLPNTASGWPLEHFALLAKNLRSSLGALVLLGGGPNDAEACDEIAARAGGDIINLAGHTTVPEWAAMLKLSDCVVANDSGGMHLATAVGAPVVAVFSSSDPKKTSPLGKSVVLQGSPVFDSASRGSEGTASSWSPVSPDKVFGAVLTILKGAEEK